MKHFNKQCRFSPFKAGKILPHGATGHGHVLHLAPECTAGCARRRLTSASSLKLDKITNPNELGINEAKNARYRWNPYRRIRFQARKFSQATETIASTPGAQHHSFVALATSHRNKLGRIHEGDGSSDDAQVTGQSQLFQAAV